MKKLILLTLFLNNPLTNAQTIEELQNQIIKLQSELLEYKKPFNQKVIVNFDSYNECEAFKKNFNDLDILIKRGGANEEDKRKPIYKAKMECVTWGGGEIDFSADIVIR